MKSNGIDDDDDDGGNKDVLGESLLIPLRRDEDDGIGGGGGIEGAPIGKNDDKNGEDVAGVGPNGGKRSVFVGRKRFRSSFKENDGI